MYLSEPVTEYAALANHVFDISPLNAKAAGVLLGLSALLGWIGSWLASSRHLKQIEPS